MAQTMLLTSGVSANQFLRNKNPLAQPKVHHFFLSGNSHVVLPSRRPSLVPLAIFKPKTKAAPKKVEKVKPKVEDGIFGTSGGIGFTKQNELFVGRVAMIGFAASLLGEALTGKGILAQLNLETGIPIYEAEPLLLFFILFTLLGAIGALGDRGKFVDDPPTGLEKAVIPPGKGVRSALGLKEQGPLFGFTKANELFVGRLAQLGIAFSLIGEIITGKGALAQLNIETGIPIQDIEPLVLLNVAFFFFAAINPGNGKFITDDGEERYAESECQAWFDANEVPQLVIQESNTEEPQVLSLGNICLLDGSWTSTDHFSGCGWVWMDNGSNIQLMGTRNITRRESALHSELEALRWAMENMLQHSTCQSFGTDCKDLIAMLKEPHAWPSFATELERIETLQICFPEFSIIHVPRARNQTSDFLAKTARSFHRELLFIGCSIPVWLPRPPLA